MPLTGQTQLRTSSEEHFQMRKMQVSLCLSSKQKAELQEKNHRKSSQASSLLNVHNAECVKAVKKNKKLRHQTLEVRWWNPIISRVKESELCQHKRLSGAEGF